MPVPLDTPRMHLRALREDDVENLVELDSDPQVMRFLNRGIPTSRDTVRDVYIPRIMAQQTADHLGFWAAHDRVTGEFLGWFHQRPDKLSPTETELGYRFKRHAWGKGLATEGCRALIALAQAAGITRFCARTHVDNRASQRVMEKLGLARVEEFWLPAEEFPGWTEHDRHSVKYAVTLLPPRP